MQSPAPDISRMVKLILDNPALMAQIRDTVMQEQPPDPGTDTAVAETSETTAAPTVADAAPHAEADEDTGMAVRRQRLLKALRPYVSPERARAIDTVMALSDVLGLMRGR